MNVSAVCVSLDFEDSPWINLDWVLNQLSFLEEFQAACFVHWIFSEQSKWIYLGTATLVDSELQRGSISRVNGSIKIVNKIINPFINLLTFWSMSTTATYSVSLSLFPRSVSILASNFSILASLSYSGCNITLP